jgi:hypothetical protein
MAESSFHESGGVRVYPSHPFGCPGFPYQIMPNQNQTVFDLAGDAFDLA